MYDRDSVLKLEVARSQRWLNIVEFGMGQGVEWGAEWGGRGEAAWNVGVGWDVDDGVRSGMRSR